MQYNLSELSEKHAQARFYAGDTVTIEVIGNDGTLESLTSNICSPTSGDPDIFRWPYSNLVDSPDVFTEYIWKMVNQNGDMQSDVDIFEPSYDKGTFLQTPFDINIYEQKIVKGDDWHPEFRIDSNSSGLKISVELTDMKTYIYKGTSNVTDRGDGLPGGDDQILLISQADTFQHFRLYVSGEETLSFEERFMDMQITVKTADNITVTPTVKKKIGFTEYSAIRIGP